MDFHNPRRRRPPTPEERATLTSSPRCSSRTLPRSLAFLARYRVNIGPIAKTFLIGLPIIAAFVIGVAMDDHHRMARLMTAIDAEIASEAAVKDAADPRNNVSINVLEPEPRLPLTVQEPGLPE